MRTITLLALSALSVSNAVSSAESGSNLNILGLHNQKHGTTLLSGVDNATGRAVEPNQANANSEDQVDYDGSYRALWANLAQDLARSDLSQPADAAFFEAALMVVSQLATLEAGIEDQRLADAALHSEVRQPFVLGYTFGAVAAAIERHGVGRHSPEANSMIIRLTQVVLLGGTFEDCVAIHKAAVADPEYDDGMRKAGDDADRFAKDDKRPFELLPWLGPRLGINPSLRSK